MRKYIISGIVFAVMLYASFFKLSSVPAQDNSPAKNAKPTSTAESKDASERKAQNLGNLLAPGIKARWVTENLEVKTNKEKKYDVNRDGKWQTSEVKIFLRDVVKEVEEKGSYLVDSDILKEYNLNNDAIITRTEANEIKKHVKYIPKPKS